MKENRLCWSAPIVHQEDAEEHDGAVWHLDSPDNRETLKIVMECGNQIYGPGSYWLEEREA